MRRMWRVLTLLSVMGFAATTAQAGGAAAVGDGRRAARQSDDWRIGADLARTRWRLQEMDGRPLEATSAPTLEFLRDLQVRGSTGCSSYVGPFASRADKGVFGPFRTSEDLCDPALQAQESLYLERLQAAWRMRLEAEGQVLLAFPRPEREPLRFARQP